VILGNRSADDLAAHSRERLGAARRILPLLWHALQLSEAAEQGCCSLRREPGLLEVGAESRARPCPREPNQLTQADQAIMHSQLDGESNRSAVRRTDEPRLITSPIRMREQIEFSRIEGGRARHQQESRPLHFRNRMNGSKTRKLGAGDRDVSSGEPIPAQTLLPALGNRFDPEAARNRVPAVRADGLDDGVGIEEIEGRSQCG
jgi:hypothetical protein